MILHAVIVQTLQWIEDLLFHQGKPTSGKQALPRAFALLPPCQPFLASVMHVNSAVVQCWLWLLIFRVNNATIQNLSNTYKSLN